MTNLEFEEIRNKFREGEEVKVRYYTYNKQDYIDVIGKIYNMYGIGKSILSDTHHLTILYLGIHKVHDRFTGKNHPKLRLFSMGTENEWFCHMQSCEIISITPISVRAYKIHKLKQKKVSEN